MGNVPAAIEEILAFELRRGTLPYRHSRWRRMLRTGCRRPGTSRDPPLGEIGGGARRRSCSPLVV